MLIPARSFLGVPAQPVGQALSRRSRPQPQPLSQRVIEAHRYVHGHASIVAQCKRLISSTTTGPGSGSATYTYNCDGQTTSIDQTSDESLGWYADGSLQSVTTSAGTTSFIYDADGNLLLQQAPGQTTLYIFGEQLDLNTTTGPITGTRFLNLPGGGTVIRTGSGTS